MGNSKYADALKGFQNSDKKFIQVYWRAFLFFAISIGILIGIIILITTSNDKTSSQPSPIMPLLLIPGVLVVLWRTIRSPQGFGFKKDHADFRQKHSGSDSLFFTLVIGGIRFCLSVALFGVLEPIWQTLFLIRAWNAWRNNQVMVDEAGNIVASA